MLKSTNISNYYYTGTSPERGSGDGVFYAQGNILATYTKDGSNEIKLGEYNLYGSSRLGTANYSTAMSNLSWQNSGIYSRTLGLKRYEISNHLGNVLTVFSDKKHTLSNTNRTTPYILSTTDYDPFGMIMNGRDWNPGEYRFGFNGQEKDQEIYNNQSTTTATFWEYDGRIGRRWNLDPKPQVNISDYACFGNNPNMYTDHNGDVKDKWNVDIKTGETEWVSEEGGFNRQIIQFKDKGVNIKELTLKNTNGFDVIKFGNGLLIDFDLSKSHKNNPGFQNFAPSANKAINKALISTTLPSDRLGNNPTISYGSGNIHEKVNSDLKLGIGDFVESYGKINPNSVNPKISNVLAVYEVSKNFCDNNWTGLAVNALDYFAPECMIVVKTVYTAFNSERIQKDLHKLYLHDYLEYERSGNKKWARHYLKLYEKTKNY